MSAISFSNTDILTILNRVNPTIVETGVVTLTSGTGGSFSAYQTLQAAVPSTPISRSFVVGTILNGAAATALVQIAIAIGAAGSETTVAGWFGSIPALAIAESVPFVIQIPIVVTNLRISWTASSDQGTAATLRASFNGGAQ